MLYYMKTFGCQMNVSDSEMLATLLVERGFDETENERDADLIIVNTCSVREKAEVKAERKILEFAKTKQKHALLWVVGCMAQRVGEELMGRIPQVSRVIGAKEIEFVEESIDAYLAPLGSFSLNEGRSESSWSAFLPVMRGCDKFCTYCIVPHVRGREHSIPLETVLKDIRAKVDRGTKEITLLGQTVNSYQDEDTDFADLLRAVSDIEGVERIRFTSPHPKDISDKVIATVAELPKVCNHIHLPVQAGSDSILKRMNRTYTSAEFLERVDKIRELIPNVDITTDVMVGFPGETDEDFQATMDLFKKVRFTSAFMFAFSPRKGTGAANYKDQVPHEVKVARLNELVLVQTEITKESYNALVGTEVTTLLTHRQEGKKGGAPHWLGQDQGFKRVLVENDSTEIGGTEVTGKVIRSTGMTLVIEENA
jgi:tRNA-2-methylthio-N6-dimethylallyladenosine synthase